MTLVTRRGIANRCPHCGYQTDCVSSVGSGRKPGDGNLSLCFECGEWAVFGPDLRLRAPTDKEFVVIGEDKACRTARAAWVLTQRNRRA